MTHLDRRAFLATGAAAAGLTARTRAQMPPERPFAPKPPSGVVICSAGRTGPVERAMEELQRGARPVDAVVEGVTLYEDDPTVTSVGMRRHARALWSMVFVDSGMASGRMDSTRWYAAT